MKKFILSILFSLFIISIGLAANEDLTTWTIVADAGSDHTVSSNLITASLNNNDTSYMYKDLTAIGDFCYEFTFYSEIDAAQTAEVTVIGVTNTPRTTHYIRSNNDGLILVTNNTSTQFLRLEEDESTVNDYATIDTWTKSKNYYFTFQRTGDVVETFVFDDAARTKLLQYAKIVGSATSFRYVQLATGNGYGGVYAEYVFNISDVNLSGTHQTYTPTLDKFMGWLAMSSPTPQSDTGTATSISQDGGLDIVLNDTTKNWTTNQFVGQLLQPGQTENYFIIASNTATSITVIASDLTGGSYKDLLDYNTGTSTYTVLGQWRTEKINGRWWVITPLDHVFWIKSMNNFYMGYANQVQGAGYNGNNLDVNIQAKYGVSGSQAEHTQVRLATLKKIGFNSTGSDDCTYNIPGVGNGMFADKNRWLVHLIQCRIIGVDGYWETNTGLIGSEPDFYDPDLVTDVVAAWNDCDNSDMSNALCPYAGNKRIRANPYIMGYDLANEPSGYSSENGGNSKAYTIFKAALNCTADGVNDSKYAMINQLRAKYTAGDEGTFVANIDFEGSDEITPFASWSGVTGYVSYAKDAAALVLLNTAWTTTYADWAAVAAEDGTVLDTKIPYIAGINDSQMLTTDPAAIKVDFTMLSINYFRKFNKVVYTDIFHSDDYLGGTKLNLSTGFHGWSPSGQLGYMGSRRDIVYGLVGKDGTKYVDIIGVGDPFHSPHKAQADPVIWPALKQYWTDYYDTLGIPIYHESTWLTAEADSANMPGTNKVTSSEYSTYGILTDANADFDTKANNANAYAHSVKWVLFNPNEAAPRKYFKVRNSGATQTTIQCESCVRPGGAGCSLSDFTDTFPEGGDYVLGFYENGHCGSWGDTGVWFPTTQEERAAYYIRGVRELIDLQGSNGDYFDVGLAWWSFWDYGYGDSEHRNFGLASAQDNLYDGVEATTSGADGIVGTADDEFKNYGDFVTPVTNFLNNIYGEIYTGTEVDFNSTASGVTLQGAEFK